MYIKIKNKSFIDESDFIDTMFLPSSQGSNIELAKLFTKGVLEQLNLASYALELGTNKMSLEEFVTFINKLYDITLEDKDYYNIFSIAYNKSFKPYSMNIISTYMVRNIQKNNGYDFWDEDAEIKFKIVYSEDFRFKSDNRYTIEEIKQLIKEKKIIILDEIYSDVTIKESLQEAYEKFPIHKNYQSISEDNPFYYYIVVYIRKALTNDQIKNDIYEYLVNLKSRIDEMLSNMNVNPFIKGMSIECQRELDKKNILARLDSLLEQAKSIKEQSTSTQKSNNHTLSKKYPNISQ